MYGLPFVQDGAQLHKEELPELNHLLLLATVQLQKQLRPKESTGSGQPLMIIDA